MTNKDLNLLYLFEALWQERNLSKAAKKLHLSQPAASHSLKRLRTTFGDSLFVRASRGMVPTPVCEKIAPQVFKTLLEVKKVFEEASLFQPEHFQGILKISYGDVFGVSLLPAFLKQLTELSPQTQTVAKNELENFPLGEMESGQIDLAITGVHIPEKEGFYSKVLFTDRLSCCYSKKIRGAASSVKSYLQQSHLFVSPTGRKEGLVDQSLAQEGLSRSIRYVVPGFLEAGPLLQESDLVLTAPHQICQHLAKFYELTLKTPPVKLPEFPIYMYWHERTNADPFAKWIRALLTNIARNKGLR